MRWIRKIAMAAALAGAPGAALAGADAAPVRDSESCQALALADPAAGREAAAEWARFGGGPAAVICEALALDALGARASAAAKLEGLAADAQTGFGVQERAELYGLAGRWWLRAGRAAQAARALGAALALDGASGEWRRLRAEARAALGEWQGAAADLDRALAARPDDAALRAARARARLEAGDAAGALADAAAVTDAAPREAEGWLTRGRAEAALGRRDEARESLMRAMDLGRDTPLEARARTALQRMELAAAGAEPDESPPPRLPRPRPTR